MIKLIYMKITKSQHDEIIRLYVDEGFGCTKLAKQFGVSEPAITKLLKKVGVQRPKVEPLNGKQDIISSMYKVGKSSVEIAAVLNCSHTAILKVLKKNGVEVRNSSECHRINEINENFFDVIDSQEKAYVLGFIYADGCNQQESNMVTMNLSAVDVDILYKISKLIYINDSEKMIKFYKRTKIKDGITKEFSHSVLSINSKHICNILNQIGCGPRKSLTLTFPMILVNKELIRHFIRGYYDGDGGTFFTKIKGRGCCSTIISTRSFCEVVGIHINNELCIRPHTGYIKGNDKLSRLYISGNRQVRTFLDWLYKGSTIHLDRKNKIYQKIINEIKRTNARL